MQGWYGAPQLILQILSNPAWSGISSLCSLVGIPLAILLARRTQPRQIRTNIPILKKVSNLHQIFTSFLLMFTAFLHSFLAAKV